MILTILDVNKVFGAFRALRSRLSVYCTFRNTHYIGLRSLFYLLCSWMLIVLLGLALDEAIMSGPI